MPRCYSAINPIGFLKKRHRIGDFLFGKDVLNSNQHDVPIVAKRVKYKNQPEVFLPKAGFIITNTQLESIVSKDSYTSRVPWTEVPFSAVIYHVLFIC